MIMNIITCTRTLNAESWKIGLIKDANINLWVYTISFHRCQKTCKELESPSFLN